MGEEKSLEETPTWAVALVCTVFVVASLLLERALNALGKVRRNLRSWYHNNQHNISNPTTTLW